MSVNHREDRATECPKCRAHSPLEMWDEADVGVGVITGNHVWCCPEHGLFDENLRFQADEPEQPDQPDPMASAVHTVFDELLASAGEASPTSPPTSPTSMTFEISDMRVFREAALRAANGEGFHLPPGLAKVKL